MSLEFSIEKYIKEGHLSPWYPLLSPHELLATENPYNSINFELRTNTEQLWDIVKAKSVANAACGKLASLNTK